MLSSHIDISKICLLLLQWPLSVRQDHGLGATLSVCHLLSQISQKRQEQACMQWSGTVCSCLKSYDEMMNCRNAEMLNCRTAEILKF